MVIRAEGSKIAVELNGAKVVEGDVSGHPESLAKHPGIRRKAGFLGLQSHSEPVEFRNLAIRELR
jgi:hypothetical protein